MYTEDSEKGEGSVYSSFGQRSMDQDNYSRDGYEDDDAEGYDFNRTDANQPLVQFEPDRCARIVSFAQTIGARPSVASSE